MILPIGIALNEIINRRLPNPWLGLPALTYLAWGAVVRGLTETSLSTAGTASNRLSIPFEGLTEATAAWSLSQEWMILGITIALTITAALRRPTDPLVSVAVVGLGIATVMSVEVWADWADWTRALAPVHLAILGLVLTPDEPAVPIGEPIH